MEDALNLYESFYYIHRQPTWGDFPPSCGCLGCCKCTICKHTALLTSLFRTDTVVPDNLVAETPALRKKCSKVRGTAGPRRARLLQEIAKQKKKASTSKLAYVSEPVPPVPDPDPPVPDPVRSESRQGSPPPAPRFIQPSPNMQSSDDVMFPRHAFMLASAANSLVRQDAPAPSAAAKPYRREHPARQAIAAPSAKKVNLQSHACAT